MAKKTNKKQPVKSKAKKPVVKAPVLKKTAAAKTKAVKKPVKKVVAKAAPKKAAPAKAVKKPVAKAKAPIKAVKKAVVAQKKPVVAVKAPKVAKPVVEKVVKVKTPPKSRKKPTKIDKKMARTLIKIANSQKTAVATVGVQSAAMNAVRATMIMAAAANANQPQSQPAQHSNSYANANQHRSSQAPAPMKPMDPNAKAAFKPGDVVVYPAHGVGKVDGVEAHTIGGTEVKLFRITFDHERMTLKVPVQRATGSGLRQLSSKETMKNVFETMKGRPRVRRVMWSRRAQEYEQKINSGDPVAIAEVLRDLRRNAESGDQSYSERQIFQNALERLSREVAAIEKIDQEKATQKLSDLLLRKLSPSAANTDDSEDAA